MHTLCPSLYIWYVNPSIDIKQYCVLVIFMSLSFTYIFLVFKFPLLISTTVPPAISPEVMDQTKYERDTTSFTCQATGEPVPTISWYFNDDPVDVTYTMKYEVLVSMSFTSTLSTLRINNVQSSDVGTYTCNATNVVSSDTSSGVLTVNGKSHFII